MGLVGPNGAGKTTTLRCLAGIIPATRGTIRVRGHDLAADPIAAKQQLAFFSDEPRLFDYLTVDQHLAFTARIYQVADYRALARPLLEELEIADKADKLPGELSRGMKQKLVIACGLLHSPKVIFFDEPLTGLDPIGIRRMKDSILKRAPGGARLHHHLARICCTCWREVCSNVLIVKNGHKVIDGTLDENPAKVLCGTGRRESGGGFLSRDARNRRASPHHAMTGALFFLLFQSWKNRTAMRFRRLKRPSYTSLAPLWVLFIFTSISSGSPLIPGILGKAVR